MQRQIGSFNLERLLRWLFALAAAALLGWLLWNGFPDEDVLAAASINCDIGVWSIRFLTATLAMSPLSRWTRRSVFKRWRRPLGLASFAFALGHAVHYVIYARVWPDFLYFLIIKPYLFIGSVATILLAVMAATSTNDMVRRLSPKVWKRLHTVVYVALPLSLVHAVLGFWDLRGESRFHIAACLVLALARWGRIGADLTARRFNRDNTPHARPCRTAAPRPGGSSA